MSLRRAFWLPVGLLLLFAALYAQRPFRTYIPLEGADSDAPIPPDANQPADFILGRLMYPYVGRGFGGGNWLLRSAPAHPCRGGYLGYMRDIAENWLDWRKMGPMVREYQALISADVETDAHKIYTFTEF